MKSLRIYLIVCAVLLIGYVVMEYNRPKPTDWSVTYYNTHKLPFGTYILYNRINDIFPGTAVSNRRGTPYSVLADSVYKNSAYIIVCGSLRLSNADYNQLDTFAAQGNSVFIAAADFGNVLKKRLNIEHNNPYVSENDAEYISFVNPRLDTERQYFIDKGIINNYFGELDTARAVVLGKNDKGKANFVRYSIGKGFVYISTNPGIFTNYSLLKPQGAQYASAALSYLKSPANIIWDEYYTRGAANAQSPMRVFFNNDALRWAYYIAIFGLLTYVLYGIKRRQRIIPVVEPLPNSTLDFVNVVGQVYYEQRDNLDIAHKKMTYFFIMLRDKYLLRTNNLDQGFTNALAKKTGVDREFADRLVSYFNYIGNQSRVTDNELIELNKLIEKFYTLSV